MDWFPGPGPGSTSLWRTRPTPRVGTPRSAGSDRAVAHHPEQQTVGPSRVGNTPPLGPGDRPNLPLWPSATTVRRSASVARTAMEDDRVQAPVKHHRWTAGVTTGTRISGSESSVGCRVNWAAPVG